MTFLELMANLRLWPFDEPARPGMGRAAGGEGTDEPRPILLPESMQPVVQAARWPTEYERRTRH
jgi:hypothetical protein